MCHGVKTSEKSAKVSSIVTMLRTTVVKCTFLFPPASVTQTPHKHLVGTDIRYPTYPNYADLLKASVPEGGTTAYTENTKDTLLTNT